MKNIITQYAGLKREVYVLFVGRIVTAMGSFVWPMLTFLLTTKLGFSDGVATMAYLPASGAAGRQAGGPVSPEEHHYDL